jgi:hypothetical protein
VATTFAVQDYSQLKKDYGHDQAEVIMNISGNIICGQAMGDTGKQLSERFGKIMQERNSVSINSEDTSTSRSMQLDYAIPASKIAALSSGQFVGMVADDPDNKIELKVFHSEIQNDHEAIRKEESGYKPIPIIKEVSNEHIEENYRKIKREIEDLFMEELVVISKKNQDEATIAETTNANQANPGLEDNEDNSGSHQSVSM